jgi:OOP family OmpA-OmpF porin
MKKILILIAIVFATTTVAAQDYNKWALSAEFGNQMVGDKTAVSVDNFSHFGLGVRYNINEIVGVGVTGGYDFTSLSEEFEGSFGPEYDFEYGRVNVEGYLNAFKVVDLYSKRWTVLFHGGTGLSFIKGNETNKERVLNLRGGATLLYKLSPRLAAYADFSTTSNINQTKKFDGSGVITNTGMSSNVSNISVGLTLYLGKKDKDGKRKEHADWYVAEPIVPIINNVTNVNEYPTKTITKIVTEECSCDTEPVSEYVFFDHDEYVIRATELNAIYKAFASLDENADYRLDIRGFASPTSSSSEYNQTLSENRTNALKVKLVGMGLDESRITTSSYGKDLDRSNEVVHDIARRVELLIIRK